MKRNKNKTKKSKQKTLKNGISEQASFMDAAIERVSGLMIIGSFLKRDDFYGRMAALAATLGVVAGDIIIRDTMEQRIEPDLVKRAKLAIIGTIVYYTMIRLDIWKVIASRKQAKRKALNLRDMGVLGLYGIWDKATQAWREHSDQQNEAFMAREGQTIASRAVAISPGVNSKRTSAGYA